MKIAFVCGEGIGNMCEQLPAFKFAKDKYPNATFDIINTVPHCFWFTQYLFKDKECINQVITTKQIPKDYKADGKIIMPYVVDVKQLKNIKNLSKPTFNYLERIYNSEVKCNLKVVSDKKVPKNCYDVKEFFPVRDDIDVRKFDVVFHNGCNKNVSIPKLWDVKLYKSFGKVNKLLKLKEFSTCSIGVAEEYLSNTVDMSGKAIEESIEIIRNCRLFVSNDTGTAHIAAALGVPGITIFTATSPWKNTDDIFHKSMYRMRRTDLNCSPCQKKGNGYWLKCEHQKCRDINPKEVYHIAMRMLKKKDKVISLESSN